VSSQELGHTESTDAIGAENLKLNSLLVILKSFVLEQSRSQEEKNLAVGIFFDASTKMRPFLTTGKIQRSICF
jgi:hypothetical protein